MGDKLFIACQNKINMAGMAGKIELFYAAGLFTQSQYSQLLALLPTQS